MRAKPTRRSADCKHENDRPAITVLPHLEALTEKEISTLASCEDVISKHLIDFFNVGFALMTIQELKLYRESFSTFEDYCRERWGFGRSHAYRLLDAAKIHKLLSPLRDIPLPDNERQIRPLTGLPPKTAEKAWRLAVEQAGNTKPTSAIVNKVVQSICNKSTKAKSQPGANWQALLIPLLKKALAEAKKGDQESVIGTLQKASLTVDIGRCHNKETDHTAI